jgi:hypothetical protein
MAVDYPKIEGRDFDALLGEFKSLVPFYTPEWRLEGVEKGPDMALVKIFIHFLRIIYHRLNRLPEKHFIAFLDRIGVKLIPAQSAAVPVTFVLSEGAAEHVLIPARTQVAAGEVIFETQKNLLAAPAQLVDIYSTDGSRDAIFGCPPHIVSGEPVLQKETKLLYPALRGDTEIFVESAEDLQEGDIVRIGGGGEGAVPEAEYAVVSTVSDNQVGLRHPLEKGESGHWRLPPIAVRGVGQTFSLQLKEAGIVRVGQLLEYRGRTTELARVLAAGRPRSIDYYDEQAENILEAAEKCILDDAYEEMLSRAVAAGTLPPLLMPYHQAGEAVKKVTRLELFEGKNLQEHVLYLGHDKLFNIDGDAVVICRVSPTKWASSLSDPGIVQWQYWGEAENPNWHPLQVRPGDLSCGEFYVRKAFSGQVAQYPLNGTTGRWIRCKIKDIDRAGDIELKDIRLRVVTIRFPDLPTEAIRGIEAVFSRRLADQGIDTVGQLLEYRQRYPEVAKMIASEEASLKYYEAMAKNFLENTAKHLLDEAYENMLIGTAETAEMMPDMVFCNDLVADLSASGSLVLESYIYPFGKKPAAYDTFYISCREIFTRPELDIHIHFQFSGFGVPGDNGVELRWEYWDGEMWDLVKNLQDTTGDFSRDGEVVFPVPAHFSAAAVNGKDNLWVRVRLISGDYGREEFKEHTVTVGDAAIKVFKPDYSKIRPPVIKRLTLTAARRTAPLFYAPDLCLTANNLELADRLKESRDPAKVFKPFVPLEEESLCFYLAFDRKLEKGPVSLFFAVDERPVSPEQIPAVHWQYFNENQCWQRLDVLDATMSLTRSGVVEFVFPLDFKQTRRFGRRAYWLRARYAAAPTVSPITGVFLNTAWALQCETIGDEIVGSGDGTAGQTFSLKKTPVIVDSQAVWVNEIKTISAEERSRVLEQREYAVRQVFDEKEKETVTAFWVRWKPVESILYASADERSYEIDNVSGQIVFGDGINGKIPPSDADNIKADYRSGGGVHGNLAAFQVKDLKAALPFVDKAYNPLAAAGGTDTETIDQVMQRGPYLLKHRNRAITAEDVEQLAAQASPGIARVRCLANMNERREAEDGRVTVIVIPRSDEERPGLSLQLQRKIEQYLDRRAPYTLVEKDHLKVIGPVYVEVSVYAQLVAVSVDEVPPVEKAGYLQVKDFLNPLTGGGEGEGWDFGKIPCFSDFYALLEKIEGVDHVEELSLRLKIPDQAGTYSEYPLISGDSAAVRIPPYALVCSGEHQISVGF